jgi:hypothetical protein
MDMIEFEFEIEIEIEILSLSKHKFAFVSVDDYSRVCWTFPLQKKPQTYDLVKNFTQHV